MHAMKSMILLCVAGALLVSGCAVDRRVMTEPKPKAVPHAEAPPSRQPTLPTALPLPTEPAAPF